MEIRYVTRKGNLRFYIIVNELVAKKVEQFIVEERVDSDHTPISVYITADLDVANSRKTE